MKKTPETNSSNFLKEITKITQDSMEFEDENTSDVFDKVYDFYSNSVQKAIDSYEIGEQMKLCYRCGVPMNKGSLAYDEGYHFDTCL